MEYRSLGTTDLKVSIIGLGTMTFGEQNSEQEAHAQLDYAVDHGVNLIDCAEMYPVPPRAETQGRTEAYIGSWLKARGRRDDVIVATKVVGPSRGFPWIREGRTRLTKAHVIEACEGSLRRLNTDVIDLYQLHWPDRRTNYFGSRSFKVSPDEEATPLQESLEGLQVLVEQGKVRHVGLSNETPWGLHHCLRLHAEQGLPRVQAIQNPYNLLNRLLEVGLAEMMYREQVGLLAYSPLAMGVLSGKYRGGTAFPDDARLTLFNRFQRYQRPAAWAASEAYVTLAREHGLDPAQMALAFINQQPWVSSNLIGATTMGQLRSNIASAQITLSSDLLREIGRIFGQYPNPAP